MEFFAALHPKVIHFPIALFITSVLFDLIGIITKKEYFYKSAHMLLFLGVLGAFAAALTGNQAFTAYQSWNEASSKLFENHQTFANITIWYFTVILILRTYLVTGKKYIGKIKIVVFALSIIGCYFIFQTAEYGGDLVKKFGVGTDLKINISGGSE